MVVFRILRQKKTLIGHYKGTTTANTKSIINLKAA